MGGPLSAGGVTVGAGQCLSEPEDAARKRRQVSRWGLGTGSPRHRGAGVEAVRAAEDPRSGVGRGFRPEFQPHGL